jgi:hypothetical protein
MLILPILLLLPIWATLAKARAIILESDLLDT